MTDACLQPCDSAFAKGLFYRWYYVPYWVERVRKFLIKSFHKTEVQPISKSKSSRKSKFSASRRLVLAKINQLKVKLLSIAKIINLPFENGCLIDDLKLIEVISNFEKNDDLDKENYRPTKLFKRIK